MVNPNIYPSGFSQFPRFVPLMKNFDPSGFTMSLPLTLRKPFCAYAVFEDIPAITAIVAKNAKTVFFILLCEYILFNTTLTA